MSVRISPLTGVERIAGLAAVHVRPSREVAIKAERAREPLLFSSPTASHREPTRGTREISL